MRTPKKFAGKWPITETEMWDEDALDLVEPAHIRFDSAGGGSFRMIAIRAEIDPRFEGDRVEFTWAGDDDGTDVSGRGWADLGKDGKLRGRIYIHLGDDSAFVAKRGRT